MSATTMGLVVGGLVLSAAGTAVTAYSQYEATQAQNRANNYNAQMMQRNAQVAELQAKSAIEQGKIDEKAHRQKVQQMIGTQRAGFANNGLLVDNGTTLDVTGDTADLGTRDAMTIRNNAARQAWGFRNQAADYTGQANLATMKNSNGMLPVAGSLLSGGSQLAGSIYTYGRAGAFG